MFVRVTYLIRAIHIIVFPCVEATLDGLCG